MNLMQYAASMRHELLFFLFSPVTRIKGVGPSIGKTLERLLPPATVPGNLPGVRDILFHLPVGIVDRRFTCPLSQAPEGKIATFVVTVDDHAPPKQKRFGKQPYKVYCSNETGSLTLVFFHARDEYIKQALPVGSKRVISGKVEHFDFQIQMTHPDIITTIDKLADAQKIEAVYPLTVGLTSRRIHSIVMDALAKIPELPEWIANVPPPTGGRLGGGRNTKVLSHDAPLPSSPLWGEELLSFKSALSKVHNPETEADLIPSSPARSRLAYDEMFATQLHLAILRSQTKSQSGEVLKGTGELTSALRESLPYKLTSGQEAVLADIYKDIESGQRMTRLLQGDVGSGKTIVALFAMLRAVEQGGQAALMVPTELIAQQHYENISKLLQLIKPSPLEGEGGEQGEPGEGYNSDTLQFAKKLRSEMTDAEKKLWSLLRSRQLEIYKFRRQQPIGAYIADFFCAEYGVIIELDGGQHAENMVHDNKRTAFLESHGYKVLRFWNNEVLQNIEGIAEVILNFLKSTPHPNPSPSRGEGLDGAIQGERGLQAVLLTGSVKGKARKEALEAIKNGTAGIVIGTHALFQEHVEFANLTLVVIDEQHRFGVGQRMALSHKGNNPHLLHLTATPIPRSLAMTLYGDMDSSKLTEKPAGRQPITTRLIPATRYNEIMERLKAALDRGEKAYWICPLIDDQNNDEQLLTDIAAAKSRYTEFSARFGDMVGLVHGRMKADERNAEMQKFTEGKTKLLVATTVVEVGVDVRDATIIVIEKAERFGLSQLHQLRGRVGRGSKPSACVLLYSEDSGQWSVASEEVPNNTQSLVASRLSILRETEDGFKIAEADLANRGAGELLGTRQSGMPKTIFMDLHYHQELLEQARDDAVQLLQQDPELTSARGEAARILLQLFMKEYEASSAEIEEVAPVRKAKRPQ